jgi:hypothetical protein
MVRLWTRGMLASVLAMGSACLGDGPSRPSEPTVAELCERFRDHAIDLQLGDSLADSPDREAHRRALRASVGDAWVSECASEASVAQLTCAIAATDAESLVQCGNEATP